MSRAVLGLAVLVVGVPAAGGAGHATSTVTVELNGAGVRVVSSPAGIDCPGACSHDFSVGTKVTLTATAASGYRVARWFSECDAGTGGTSGTCAFDVPTFDRSLGLLALPAGTLQIAPRGLGGAVRISPPGLNVSGGAAADPVCEENERDNSCERAYAPGTQVTLTAAPDSTTTFSDWSDPDCRGTGPCTLTVGSGAKTVVATFAKLTLRVRMSSSDSGRVTSTPSGIDCPDVDCSSQFPAHSKVTLHVAPGDGHSFRRWAFGCDANGKDCTATMNDEPQWVGVVFDDDNDPDQPGTVDVAFEVRKAGDGSGRVSSKDIDCGETCSREYTFGTTLTLEARVDDGSSFGGWGGVCEQTKMTCTVPVGPITAIQARFDKKAAGGSAVSGVSVLRAVARGTRAARRVVTVVQLPQATMTSLKLTLGSKIVASRRYPVNPGANTLTLRLPRKARPGRYVLTVSVPDPAGGSRTFTRSVRIGR